VYPTWWVWPNRLALDAPVVAVVWQRFLADAHGLTVPPPVTVVLGLTVWGIYLADRWLDAAPGRVNEVADRHRFARRHRGVFGAATVGVLGAAAVVAGATLPEAYLPAGCGVAVVLGLYGVKAHTSVAGRFAAGEKELAVGLTFALGVGLPLLVDRPEFANVHIPSIGSFAALCWLNCGLIAQCETTSGESASPEWSLIPAAGTAVGLGVFAPPAVTAAVVASSVLLGGLHLYPARFDPTTRRVLADAVLLTPLPFVVAT
jgi:hypothetical protein